MAGESASAQSSFKEFAKQRRAIIRALVARGLYPDAYGFNRHVMKACQTEGVPCSDSSVSRDVKRVREEMEQQEVLKVGKSRLLEMILTEIHELNLMDLRRPDRVVRKIKKGTDGTEEVIEETTIVGRIDPNLVLKRSREKMRNLERIAKLEGLFPKEPAAQVNINVMQQFQSLPVNVYQAFIDAGTESEKLRVLEDALGEDGAMRLLESVAGGQ